MDEYPTKSYIVVLDLTLSEDEADPSEWDWPDLLDLNTAYESVRVVGVKEISIES